MASPRVSVVIPTYNRVRLLRRAIDSAFAALEPEDEVIVVDDGSTDDTASLLSEYRGRIRSFTTSRRGPGAARNLGIEEARHPLVAFLDSDDAWMPDKIQLQRALMERRTDVLFCFSDFAHRDRTGAETHACLAAWHRDPRSWDAILAPGVLFSTLAPLPPGRSDFRVYVGDLYSSAVLGDYVCTSTAVVRRTAAAGALRFAEDLMKYEDWQCFARVAAAGPAAYLDCETQWNCDHAGSRLTRADELTSETARIVVLDRVWGADSEFLARHGELYRRVLAGHRRARARALMALGRNREARQELALAGGAPLAQRILASLPGGLARAFVAARRRLRDDSAPSWWIAPGVRLSRRLRRWFGGGAPRMEAAEIMLARRADLRALSRVPKAFSVRPATLADRSNLDGFVGDPARTSARLASGDTCLLALGDGEIQAVEWIRWGPTDYQEDAERLGIVFRVPSGSCWLHNGRNRTKGLIGPWALVMGRLRGVIESRGVETAFLQVDAEDGYSIACHESLGFRRVGQLVALRFLSACVVAFRRAGRPWARMTDGEFDLDRLDF